jgi:hypothetical protein
MAADILREKACPTIEDIDRMLSDENLSVQIIGIRSISDIRKSMEYAEFKHFKANPRPTEAETRRFSRTYDPVKKQLIPVLLKYLNDNHFYIRTACYDTFVFMLERRRFLPGRGMRIEKPEMLAKRFQWERESWWKYREEQQKLLAWWEKDSASILLNSGPDWFEETTASSQAP